MTDKKVKFCLKDTSFKHFRNKKPILNYKKKLFEKLAKQK